MEPRPAASVMIIRNLKERNGIEVLMLKRSTELDFAAGIYVFPGGAIDPDDRLLEWACLGYDDENASKVLGLESGGIAYFVGAIRECFEEAGVLLAASVDGDSLNSSSGHLSFAGSDNKSRYQQLRDLLNGRSLKFHDLVASNNLALCVGELHYVSHWITPLGRPRRYDTRFFVASMPDDQVATHDDVETVDFIWIDPNEALRLHGRNEIPLVAPTIANLMSISRFSRVEEVLSWADTLSSIPTIAPEIVLVDGKPTVVVSGHELN